MRSCRIPAPATTRAIRLNQHVAFITDRVRASAARCQRGRRRSACGCGCCGARGRRRRRGRGRGRGRGRRRKSCCRRGRRTYASRRLTRLRSTIRRNFARTARGAVIEDHVPRTAGHRAPLPHTAGPARIRRRGCGRRRNERRRGRGVALPARPERRRGPRPSAWIRSVAIHGERGAQIPRDRRIEALAIGTTRATVDGEPPFTDRRQPPENTRPETRRKSGWRWNRDNARRLLRIAG